jgi:ATP-dependent Lon protease
MMTDKNYQRATEIQKQIKDLNDLHYIACKPFKKFFLIKKFLWASTYDGDAVSLCDEGLTEIIREYCNRRIRELRKELETL